MNKLSSAVINNLNIDNVIIEATFTRGLPAFSIVGLASSEVQESRDRVKSAIQTNGFSFPPLKLTVNLSPSGVKKSGTHLDLAIALLIVMKDDIFTSPHFIFGELGLDGSVKHTNDIFPVILGLLEQGLLQSAVVPEESMPYLSMIEGVAFYPVRNLKEAIEVFKTPHAPQICKSTDKNAFTFCDEKYYLHNSYTLDFIDVKGQEIAKRAALIAASGMHNILFEGSPGCGKSMIAKRLVEILPPLTQKELLTIAKNQFLSGKTPTFEAKRVFISPHHTASKSSLFGGAKAKIGEIGLANKGLLFFDELNNFSKSSLESLREPLQDRYINISRVDAKICYETDFLFVAAMNPCPCGNLFSKTNECRCNELEIKRYKNKLSQPLLDRIDLYVAMQEVSPSDKATFSSKQMHEEVMRAFKMQKQRGQSEFNGRLNESEIEKFCTIEDGTLLHQAVERFGLSHRSINGIKKVARTIADLNESKTIRKQHLLEALGFRKR
jgi:magnesium chelatase family protein